MGGSSYFDEIAQQLSLQKQLMESLIAENQELHRQLDNLRAGHGISVEICGQRFPLLVQNEGATPLPLTTQRLPETEPADIEVPAPAPTYEQEVGTPLVVNSEVEASVAVEEQPEKVPFLEEVMIDEFASALTSPMKTVPNLQPQQEDIDEEQKARLRKELMGSFLLE